MSHCKNCKYWGEPLERGPKEIRRCRYAEQLHDSLERIWLCGTDGEFTCRLTSESLAFSQNDWDYNGGLYTRADFGCVAFVEKGND